MRIVIAPDSFKGSATAVEVCSAIEVGLGRVFRDADIVCVPMADGGEGTLDALIAATNGHQTSLRVSGPLGNPVDAAYGVLGDGHTAVIEMASASGLNLVPPNERDPARASTRGTGELMRHAIEAGSRRIIVCIGGSATNDGGAGMAQALGFSLKDADGVELEPGGMALAKLSAIDAMSRHAGLDGMQIDVACDVDNPLCGPTGASLVYGPQKGASPEIAALLDDALRHFGEVLEQQFDVSVLDLPGAGAAGGLGAGLVAFTGARLLSGIDLVCEICGLEDTLSSADLVITGEGKIDGQSVHGKTPVGVARLAKKKGIPVIAFAGELGEGHRSVYAEGITAAYSICRGPIRQALAMAETLPLLADAAETFARSWAAAKK